MHPTYQFRHTNGYRAQRYRCPLLYPARTGESCKHEQFAKGKGCVKDINIEAGGLMRVTLDRDSPLYKAVYTQRTCCERINSQTKDLGYSPTQSAQHSLHPSAQYPDLYLDQRQSAPTSPSHQCVLAYASTREGGLSAFR
jgi:hypothetical protein